VKRLDAMREARIVHADHALLPGMFAEAAIVSARAAGARPNDDHVKLGSRR
jgi:hypothetical protein